MLMREQKTYEDGSVLTDELDDIKHDIDTMAEFAELAQDRNSWQATKHAIGSSKRCSNPPKSRAHRAGS